MKKKYFKNLEEAIRKTEKLFKKGYTVNIQQKEKIPEGPGVVIANHFNYLDPLFVLYSVAKETKRKPHPIVKQELLRMPIARKYMQLCEAIATPRPKKGEKITKEDIKRLKNEIKNYLEKGELIYLAYSGTRTGRYHNFWLNEEALEKELELARQNTGIIGLIHKMHIKNLWIMPVAIDTYEKDSSKIFGKMLLGDLGLFIYLNKKPIDIIFGKPRFLEDALNAETKQELMEEITKEIFELRKKNHEKYLEDDSRSLEKYL